jgi:conjugative relaxase-like TrwC/TraI family protein
LLTSCKLTGSPASISAYHTKEENYYFSQASGAEPLSENDQARSHVRIHGKLAGRLGLTPGGEISQQAFTNILAGKDAAGNKVCREHKVMGIDLVFSAPKSVSIAGLLTEKDPRIVEAHDQAVLETMRELEAQHAAAQPRPGESVPTGNMAYVTARDGYNRDHDPHLHTHVVVMNLTELDGKVLALDGRRIMAQDFNKMWGAMYRAKLAARLKELGYSVSYTKKGELRLDVVSLEVEREFSSRRAQIEKAKANGCRDMDAWRKTRKQKNPEIEKAEVRADWQSRAARHQEKTAEQVRQDTVLAREAWFKEAKWSVEARQELAGQRQQSELARWQAAARRATERTACPSAEAVITEYLTELARGETWDPITYTEAQHRLQDQVRAGRLLATDDGRYTTWEMARVDRECLSQRKSPSVGLALEAKAAARQVAAYAESARAGGRRGLSEPQAAAAAGILAAHRGAVIVQGDAGAGKTTMLKAVNELAAASGWEVAGVAVQGLAARKLQEESGIESLTLASYLAREGPREEDARKPRLVVVDEASMLDSRGLAELLRGAEKHGDKVVLVGDRNQILSVGAGKPFDRLVETAKASGELLSLSENYRQRDKALREAVDLARTGRMRESIDALARQGKVLEIEDKGLRRAAVAMQYDKDTLILTGSREGREQLNAIIREDLVSRGIVDRTTACTYKLAWKDDDGVRHSVRRELARGDVVTFLANEYRLYDVRNGDRGQVVKTGRDSVAVRLEDGRQVALDLERYSALDYGYALTTYKSQGQTYNKVVVEADTTAPYLQDQRNTYVQITRARDEVRIYTDDRAELRELAGVLNAKADTHELKVSLAEARRMEVRVQEAALGRRARQEAAAKVAQVPTHPAAAGREEIRPVGICETPYTAAAKAEREALEAAERALTRAQATDQEKDWQAWEKAKGIAQKAKEATERAALAETVQDPILGKDAVRAEAARVQRLDLIRQDAARAAREAEKASDAAAKRHDEARGEWNEAQARAANARLWGKKAAKAAEKTADQSLEAAHGKSQEAWSATRSAKKQLEVVEERLREARKQAAETAHLNNFRGTPETWAKAAEAVLGAREAAQKLKAAEAAAGAADRRFDDERGERDGLYHQHELARHRVWEAQEQVRKARLWEKKAARGAEKAAQQSCDAAENKVAESRARMEEKLKQVHEANDRVEKAEKIKEAAQARAAKAVRINDLEATREALRARADLSPAEQHRIAEYLGRSANAGILRDCDNPQQAIAASLIASGTRSAKEATKGLEKSAAAMVGDAVKHNQENEQRRERERMRDQTHDHGFGFGLSR